MATPGGERNEKVSAFKIHVKNLPDGATSDELKAIFEEFGKVVESVVAHHKKFGFVFMEDESCGRAAITMLNGRSVRGNVITVEESTQNAQGPSVPSTRLKVKNIPSSLSAIGLKDLFSKYGIIISAEIIGSEGIVVIEAIADIRSAMKDINGYLHDGQALVVEPIINTGLSYTPKIKEPPPLVKTPLMRTPQSQPRPTRPGFSNQSPRGRGMMSNNGYRPPRMGGMRPLLPAPMQRSPMRPGPRMSFRPPPHPSECWDSQDYGYDDSWGEEVEQPQSEGRILRDPYGPGLRPPMSPFRSAMRGHMRPSRPPMGFHSPRPPLMRGSMAPMMTRQPMLSRGGMRPSRPMLRPSSSVAIEPLFHRRHELMSMSQERQEPIYSDEPEPEEFYEDEPLDQMHLQPQIQSDRVPIYGESRMRGGSHLLSQRGLLSHPGSSRGHPPLQPPPMPPMLFRNGMGPQLKRKVPEADPGQPFEVPPMIPPGMFQPPRKYFANRQKPEGPKRKRFSGERPDLPIPEQPERYVPDYSFPQYAPRGAVLKPFPPPQYNEDFSEDIELQEQSDYY